MPTNGKMNEDQWSHLMDSLKIFKNSKLASSLKTIHEWTTCSNTCLILYFVHTQLFKPGRDIRPIIVLWELKLKWSMLEVSQRSCYICMLVWENCLFKAQSKWLLIIRKIFTYKFWQSFKSKSQRCLFNHFQDSLLTAWHKFCQLFDVIFLNL